MYDGIQKDLLVAYLERSDGSRDVLVVTSRGETAMACVLTMPCDHPNVQIIRDGVNLIGNHSARKHKCLRDDIAVALSGLGFS